MTQILDINNFVKKLYQFIAKLISMIETELNEIDSPQASIEINKKAITDSLTKIVILLNQLKKLSIDTEEIKNTNISNEDRLIIDNFLKKYK